MKKTIFHHLIAACLLVLSPFSAIANSPDTDELIAQGQQALAAGDPASALLILERVILDQPWRLGAWMDYALALQQTGDVDSAQAIYQHLLSQDPPDHLRLWLKQQVQKGRSITAGWVSQGVVTLLTGKDSNLNRAPGASSLTLTYPSGPLLLPLAETARATAGSASLISMNGEAAHQSASGRDWAIQAGLNARIAPQTPGQDYLQPTIGVSRRWSGTATDETLSTLAFQQLQYGGQDLQRILSAGLYRGQLWQAGQTSCAMHYGAEWKKLTYPAAAINGQYLGIAASLGCPQTIGWNFLAHAGVDKAENPRPGGDQQQADLRAQVHGRVGKSQWLIEAGIVYLRDSTGYSPLLNDNAVRYIKRGSISLDYSYPLSEQFQGLIRLEAFRQDSSLPLFETIGQAAWMGVRYRF